jgi:hypothetical protein
MMLFPQKPCPLNAENQHFIPRFKKKFLLYGYPKEGFGVKGGPKTG